jgi:hypothetical protein
MIMGVDVGNLKKTLDKNPKSLLFAKYAEVLRLASVDNKQKLDEALLVANRGVEANPDFLPGKFVRGRILFEKGDLTGARIDFEMVAKRDPFCFSAQKLLLETAEKQGEPLKTEIYANILNTFESKTEIKVEVKKTESGKAPDLVPFTRTPKTTPSAAGTASLSAALDNILEEDEKEETEMETLIFKAVDNIIDSTTPQPPPQPPPLPLPEATSIFEKEPVAAASQPPTPEIDDIVKEQLADKPVGKIPDLTGDINSLLATSASSAPEPKAPEIDDIVKEQLADKPVGKIPDLTGDINSLLETTASSASSASEPKAPEIDDIVKEQLADKPVGKIPDLTGDINSLLETTASFAPEPKAPDIDDLVKEQLADKPVGKLPDLTGDINSLLALEPTSYSSTPQIDDIVKEQLADRVDNIPDLTGDMKSLLATASEPEPELRPYVPKKASPPPIDDIVKEQLADRVDNIPDLTGDMKSLLATSASSAPEPKVPEIDDLVKEQLADKPVGKIPDLTGDMDSLLATVKPYDAQTGDEILTQNPTQTLAELYMDQGLPQKAAAVYRELLAQEPGNEELKRKLALTETIT